MKTFLSALVVVKYLVSSQLIALYQRSHYIIVRKGGPPEQKFLIGLWGLVKCVVAVGHVSESILLSFQLITLHVAEKR